MSDFNQEAILTASDQQLNEWAAEKVMGRHRGELLYNPVTNIAQAIALLEHLRETRGGWWQVASPHDGYPYFHVAIFADGKGDIPPQVIASKSDLSQSRAITIATLLAVAEIQEANL